MDEQQKQNVLMRLTAELETLRRIRTQERMRCADLARTWGHSTFANWLSSDAADVEALANKQDTQD